MGVEAQKKFEDFLLLLGLIDPFLGLGEWVVVVIICLSAGQYAL
jgi:hypothetical protein